MTKDSSYRRRNRSRVLAAALLVVPALAGASTPQGASLTERYREDAGRLIGAALVDPTGWDKLAYLTDVIGHRLSGSQGLERAVEWTLETMRSEGLVVQRQPVMVPHWVRGEESAAIVEPVERPLAILGLGGSIATPGDGITAEVIAVSSFDDLANLPDASVEGRIVLFNVPYTGYGNTVAYRSGGASAAARRGAVAALVRSVGPTSMQTPHTGGMRYEDGVARIPAAAVTIEAATRMQRLLDRGERVRVRLQMSARFLEDAPSANVIGELRGSERPDEYVVLGGHLDSWDVGQGAHDDGAGCIAAWHAVTLMKRLGLQPRRSVRVVLWTNEENGLAGATAYREALGDAVGGHVAAIEMDGGAERPLGFGLGLSGAAIDGSDPVYENALRLASEIGALLTGVDAHRMMRGGGGADIGPLMADGVPGFGLRTIGERYFEWHHTEADTLDKIDPDDFRRNVAALAVLAYVLADMPERLRP